MKKILLIAIVASFTTLSGYAQKLGHINSQQLMTELPDWKTAETKLQDFGKKKEGQIQAMAAEYQEKLTAYQQSAEGMTQTEREASEREIMDIEKRIQTARQKAQEDLGKMEQELMAPMVNKVKAAIKQVGDEGKFIYILDVASLLYEAGGTDITPLVKAKLGL